MSTGRPRTRSGARSTACGPTRKHSGRTFPRLPRDLDPRAASAPIGRPVHDSSAYVVDAQMRLAPLGGVRDLALAGDGVASGYLKQPELTEAVFVDDAFGGQGRLYRTGDFGRRLPDG